MKHVNGCNIAPSNEQGYVGQNLGKLLGYGHLPGLDGTAKSRTGQDLTHYYAGDTDC